MYNKSLAFLVAFATVALASPLAAQDFPAKGRTITGIVPSTAGGGTDTAARLASPLMEKDLGVPVQVVNKPGASMQIGVTEVVNAKPDGYTLLWTVLPTQAAIYLDPDRKATFNRSALAPIGMVYGAPFAIFVQASSPYKTIEDLIAAAKANPGKIKSATTGHMSTGHFANLEFQRGADVKMATVHFQGGGPALTALLGGHVDVAFNSVGELVTHAKNGTIRLLAVMDENESSFFPGVKTLAAQGVKANPIGSDIGLSAPAGTPKEVITILTNSLKKATENPDFRAKMTQQGNTVTYMDPEKMKAFWDSVDAKYKPLIELAKKEAK